jgi:hypothetical protein
MAVTESLDVCGHALARAGVGFAHFAAPTTARAATILVHGQPVPLPGARGKDG